MNADYFLLAADVPAFGQGTVRQKQYGLFFGVLSGAVSQIVYDALTTGRAPHLAEFGLACIASFVTFPYVFFHAGLNRARLTFAKWCVAFQYGFFWHIVIQVIAKNLGGH